LKYIKKKRKRKKFYCSEREGKIRNEKKRKEKKPYGLWLNYYACFS